MRPYKLVAGIILSFSAATQGLLAYPLIMPPAKHARPIPHIEFSRLTYAVIEPKYSPPSTPQPTPTPTIKATLRPTPVQSYGVERWRAIVAQYDWPVNTALAIMRCESGGEPTTVSNPNNNFDHIPDYGLMQLHGVNILDPEENIKYAYFVKYRPTRTFYAWSTFKNGCYRKYL